VSASTLDRCLEAMASNDVDALLLGREAHARAVAGTRRLWLAGTRPFTPSCVVVRSPAAVHVLANTDDVVPDGFPVDHLYGITWNPERLLDALVAIPGLVSARRIGVDGMTPFMHGLLTRALPDSTFVDAAPVLTALWGDRTVEEIDAVRAAAVIARDGLSAMVDALRPGVRPRVLRGICASRFAAAGVTTPAFEAVVAPLDRGVSTWLPPERLLADGETVVLRAGVLADGWEASLARTFVVDEPPTEQRRPEGWNDIVATCRPGVTAGELRERGALVYGAGRGVEPWDDDFTLAPGSLVALEVEAHGNAGSRPRLRQDVLLVTDGEPEQLT
jgi:Xaa-Pro aminopeptidase